MTKITMDPLTRNGESRSSWSQAQPITPATFALKTQFSSFETASTFLQMTWSFLRKRSTKAKRPSTKRLGSRWWHSRSMIQPTPSLRSTGREWFACSLVVRCSNLRTGLPRTPMISPWTRRRGRWKQSTSSIEWRASICTTRTSWSLPWSRPGMSLGSSCRETNVTRTSTSRTQFGRSWTHSLKEKSSTSLNLMVPPKSID